MQNHKTQKRNSSNTSTEKPKQEAHLSGQASAPPKNGIQMPDIPKIELPKGGGALKGIGEKFKSNPITGTSSYTIPIALSKGRDGFSPQLSLNYSSGNGNGCYGLGWSLNLPSISRKTTKQLPKYEDGYESDTFIISDMEDLIPKLKKVGANWIEETYSENGHSVARYRPRIESNHTRIERWTNHSTGLIFWKSITGENISTIYGKSANSRISDPNNPKNIFQWLIEETWDAKGNVIRYEYKSEDSVGVETSLHEKNRLKASQFAQRHLKKVLYGNTIMYTDPDFSNSNKWLFQLVFDYGDHSGNSPSALPDSLWEARQDPFSSYRSGFDIRTWRLCKRILMFHDIDEIGGITLVKSTNFSYTENATATQLNRVTHKGYRSGNEANLPPLDFSYSQASIDHTLRNFDLTDLENLPSGADGQRYLWTDLYGEGITGVLTEEDGGWYYKKNQGDENYYIDHPVNNIPSPEIRFGAQETIAQKPNMGGIQLVSDFNGDGKTELLIRSKELTGYFRLEENNEWSSFKHLDNVPLINWEDPNVKLLDLNGDGVPDVLLTQDHCFSYYPSNEDQGYGDRIDIHPFRDEENGPRLVFTDPEQVIHTADMSGDGLTDLIRIRNGEVCYWPNLGHGRFGKKVAMSNAPFLDHPELFDKSRIRLADMDGSGTNDLIYLGTETLYYWNNQSGNSFSIEKRISNFPNTDNLSSVNVIDIFGKGTPCLVWSSPLPGDDPHRIRYIDLYGQKPYLLKEVDNNMGGLTRYHYSPSTKFYLRDRQEGRPWKTKLPFPVQVVERTERYDQVTGMRFVTRYAYHHGYFDSHEKEFRGFGMVEQWDSEQYEKFSTPGLFQVGSNALDEASHIPPIHTKSWYHLGFWEQEESIAQQFASEYYNLDNLAWELADSKIPAILSSEEIRQAMRALKGQLLRTEVYAQDESPMEGHPYTVSTSNYHVAMVQPQAGNRYASFQVTPQDTLNYQYERNSSDPRISQTSTLVTDSYGKITQSAAIAYPRRGIGHAQAQSQGLATITNTNFSHIDDDALFSFYRTAVPYESKTLEVTGLNFSSIIQKDQLIDSLSGATEIAYEESPSSGVQLRCISHQKMYYWDEDLNASLALGDVASHGLPYRTTQKAFTSGLITQAFNNDGNTRVTETILLNEGKYIKDSGDYWLPSDVLNFSSVAFFQMAQIDHATGGSTTLENDTYNLFTVKSTDPYGNLIAGLLDYNTLTLKESTDANGNRQQSEFDELGMIVKLSVMGKTGQILGDDLSSPTQQFSYNLQNWIQNGKPNWTKTESRENHGGSPTWISHYEYTNGFGEIILKKSKAEPGNAFERDGNGDLVLDINNKPKLAYANDRWVGTGRTINNNKGKPVKQYEPYFSSTPDFEDEDEVRIYGVSPIVLYDPLSRVIRTDMPDGSFSKVQFDCWELKKYDTNDTVLNSQWYIDRNSPSPSDPEPSALAERAAWLAAHHYNTPHTILTDVLGRPFLTIEDNGMYNGTSTIHSPTEVLTELDIEGKKLKVVNPSAQETVFFYSMLPLDEKGNADVLFTHSAESGWRRKLPRIDRNPVRSWSQRGFSTRNEYDTLKRPIKSWLDEGSGEKLIALNIYGDNIGLANPENDNFRLQTIRSYDQSGSATVDQVDFKGNVLKTTRKLCLNFKTTVDWSSVGAQTTLPGVDSSSAAMLEVEEFTSLTAFDALNRHTLLTQPDGTLHKPSYNEASMLQSIEVKLPHESGFQYHITNIDYNAKGQRTKTEYGNDTVTNYEYDESTFKLKVLNTSRSEVQNIGGLPTVVVIDIQKLSYEYDPVGNIISIQDDAQQSEFFSNTVINPRNLYEYDALYRLAKASGREKTSLSSPGSSGHSPHGFATGGTSSETPSTYCETYVYDEIGNIETIHHRDTCGGTVNWKRNYKYSGTGGNYLESIYSGTAAPTLPQLQYDPHGNLLSSPHLNALSWDYLDQLRASEKTDEKTFYVYSGGERTRKICVNTNTEKIKYERIYLGDYELYREYSGGVLSLKRESHHVSDEQRKAALLEVKTYDSGIINYQDRATITRYQYTNHLDSASIELDENAKLISYEEYHPFGTTSYYMHSNNSEVSLKRYKYMQKERDDENGFYYYGARYYAPWLCRFTSIDPLKDKFPRQNGYAYASNNPIRYVDVNGQGPDDPPLMSPDGRNLELPEKAEVCSTFSCSKNYYVTNDEKVKKSLNVYEGSVQSFSYDGKEFKAQFNVNNGKFAGYYTTVDGKKQSFADYTLKPEIVERKEWGARKHQSGEGLSYEKNELPLRSSYNMIVVHHSGNSNSPTIQDVQNEHMDASLPEKRADIGYHFAIGLDGTIYEGRPINIKGSHIDNGNTGKIGIVILGDMDPNDDGLGWKGIFETSDDTKTPEMEAALELLIKYLVAEYAIDYLGVHKDVNCQRHCPGDVIQSDIDLMRKKMGLADPECISN